MEILESLGKKIQVVREKRGLTQEALGDRAGLNAKYISSVERGQKNATIKTLIKIADGLGVELYEMFLFSEKADSEKAVRVGIDAMLKESDSKTLTLCLHFLKATHQL